MPKQTKHREGISDWLEDWFRPPEKNDSDWTCAAKALLKYQGAQPEILERYNIAWLPYRTIIAGEDGSFAFTTNSCAFCQKYLKKKSPSKENCAKCPVAKEDIYCNGGGSAYAVLGTQMDPKPMIALMEQIMSKCTDAWDYQKKKARKV